MEIEFDNEFCSCRAVLTTNRMVQLEGQIKHVEDVIRAELIAANPIMRGFSYSGSGLPYTTPEQAFEGTPNWYAIDPSQGQFFVTFYYPNSYYTNDGAVKIIPSIFLILQIRGRAEPVQVRMELPDSLPLKTLTHRPQRTGPEFYARREEIGVFTQHEILNMMGERKVGLPTA